MLKSALEEAVGMIKPSSRCGESHTRREKGKGKEMRRNKKQIRRGAIKERNVIRDAKRSREQEIQRQEGKRGGENETWRMHKSIRKQEKEKEQRK